MAPYHPAERPRTGIRALVLACFFLSGMSGLIYEILWTRMLVQIIGAAPFAVSIILAVFMGGLGLGSYLAARHVDRVARPSALIALYGALELAIGAYAALTPVLLSAFRPVQSALYNRLYDNFWAYHLATFLLCAAVLCLPVVGMGATLPILCRFYIDRLGALGARAGRLYGLNTIGAAAGSLLCGFWLIRWWGVPGTLAAAVAVNAGIGLACLLIGVKAPESIAGRRPPPSAPRAAAAPGAAPAAGRFEARAALAVFAVSGFGAMACEVVWTKLLALIVGPTGYSLTIVLVTFITGLALGSLIFGRFADRVRDPLGLLLATQAAAALLVLGVSHLLGNSQLFFAKLIYTLQDDFGLLSAAKAAALFGFMILPTLCFGGSFPLVGKIVTRSISTVGRSIGNAYVVNPDIAP